jgi:hypothetical protein
LGNRPLLTLLSRYWLPSVAMVCGLVLGLGCGVGLGSAVLRMGAWGRSALHQPTRSRASLARSAAPSSTPKAYSARLSVGLPHASAFQGLLSVMIPHIGHATFSHDTPRLREPRPSAAAEKPQAWAEVCFCSAGRALFWAKTWARSSLAGCLGGKRPRLAAVGRLPSLRSAHASTCINLQGRARPGCVAGEAARPSCQAKLGYRACPHSAPDLRARLRRSARSPQPQHLSSPAQSRAPQPSPAGRLARCSPAQAHRSPQPSPAGRRHRSWYMKPPAGRPARPSHRPPVG